MDDDWDSVLAQYPVAQRQVAIASLRAIVPTLSEHR
jgi:hypothetical protein